MYVFKPDDILFSDGLKALGIRWCDLSAAAFDRLSGVVLSQPTLTELRLAFLTLEQLKTIKQLPPNLETLELGCDFSLGSNPMPLSHLHSVWPQSLTALTLRYALDTPLHSLNLPPSLLHLTMLGEEASTYDHPLTPLPPRLQSLHIEAESIHPPDTHTHPFPHSLTSLTLEGASAHSWRAVTLPSKLRTLYFNVNCQRDGEGHDDDDEHEHGHEHDDVVTDVGLPSNMMNHPSLTDLTLPDTFNEPIQSLPPNLTDLHLGDDFNHPLDDVAWPIQLKSLDLSFCWNQPVNHLKLPNSLIELRFGYMTSAFNQPIADLHFPPNLETLTMYGGFNASEEMNQLNLRNTALTSFYIWRQDQPLLPFLPNTLRRLSVGSNFNHPIDAWHLPSSITQLELGDEFNQPLDGVTLPASLIKLKLGRSFNQPIENIKLPTNLHTFTITNCQFNHPIEALVLPPSLRVLNLSAIQNYTHPMSKLRLPPHLHSLSLPSCMRTAAEGGCGALTLPTSLRHLTYYVIVDGEERGMSIEELREMMMIGRNSKRTSENASESESSGESDCGPLDKSDMNEFEVRDNNSNNNGVDADADSGQGQGQGQGDDDSASASTCSSESGCQIESSRLRLIECEDGLYRRVWLDPFDGVNLSPLIQLHRKVGKLTAPIP